jgi:prepilin-type N-terminal cleavage/methylation domain-containing protein
MPYLLGLAHHTKGKKGFTLAELLICIAILGEIATFTIPKLLASQQNQSYNAKAKEAAATMSAAYQLYKLQNTVPTTMHSADLTPYISYVALDTSSQIDSEQTLGPSTCSSSDLCARMHNGSVIMFWGGPCSVFGGTGGSTNSIWFMVDPDGKVTDGTTNGPGHSVAFSLYYDGHIRTWGTINVGTTAPCTVRTPTPAYDPPWFSW